ncbi:MAG: hypothetical protein HRF40_06175 [Nitrososphaera sp.]
MDRFRKKAETQKDAGPQQEESGRQQPSSATGRRVKKYTSDGKPIYE